MKEQEPAFSSAETVTSIFPYLMLEKCVSQYKTPIDSKTNVKSL